MHRTFTTTRKLNFLCSINPSISATVMLKKWQQVNKYRHFSSLKALPFIKNLHIAKINGFHDDINNDMTRGMLTKYPNQLLDVQFFLSIDTYNIRTLAYWEFAYQNVLLKNFHTILRNPIGSLIDKDILHFLLYSSG